MHGCMHALRECTHTRMYVMWTDSNMFKHVTVCFHVHLHKTTDACYFIIQDAKEGTKTISTV